MNRLRDLLLFWFLFQVGNQGCHGHNDGKMGDIGFKCPSGSAFYQGYCFRKETVPMTWKDAKTACLRSGMYLAWLEDDIENEYVATHVMSDVNQYWIGLSNTSSATGQNEVSWSRYRMSEDKTIPVYKGLWKNLQPADFMEENKCVSTLKDKYDNHWTVTNCRKKLPFVCKILGAPNPHYVIFCGNGGYIHKNWKCDGQNDCGDMSDEIDCSSSCSELKMLEKGTPGSITMTSFDNNAFCTWTIQAPVGARIKITISSSFHLEENADVLSVWTGGISLKESSFLGSVTGSLQSQKEFYSQNNYIIMQLSMDGSINVRSGFTVTYATVDDAVIWNDMKKLTAGSSWQNLTSPLYGTAVPFGLQLEWLITAESYQVVSLEFLEVDLPTSSSLQVYDGEDLMAPQVFMLNKTPLHPIYISRSKSIRIVLSTDEHEYTKYRGFRLKYKEGCNIEMKQQGTIYSPGYEVGSYPSNVTCAWILTRNTEETKPISLRFTEFKVKSNSDYVEVYNDTVGTALHTGNGLTGTSDITEIFSSTNGYLNVTFKSNLVLVEKGFKAEFSVDCPMLTLSQWTINSVSDKYTALNTEIELSCQPGYSFKQEEYNKESSVALKCLAGGKWNVSRIPDCQITYCSTPPAIQNGILKSATGGKVGDNATYECNGGFTLGGSATIQCQKNGMWENQPSCNAQQCSPVSDPTNGKVNITEGSGTDFASVLMFSCDPGYDLLGSVYIHCRSNGTWSHSKPSCTEIKCPLPQVMYGKVESGGDVKYKETAKLKCDVGFIVNDTVLTEKDVTCGSDAMFSGLDPCVNKDECSDNQCGSVSNTICVDTVGSYFCKCKDGFSRSGSSGPCGDIDECAVNDGGCSDICTNNDGSYSCSCKPGYELYAYPDFNNISLANGETGTRAGDKIRINHTCVRVLCSTPISPLNGKILSNKNLFYYNDEISVECNHGYFMAPSSRSSVLKCEMSGQWSAHMPNCTKGSCMIPAMSSDPSYNRIIPNDTRVDFGTDVTIECRYGTGFRNLSLYCGESGVATYKLLGDNLTCPVIDCGTPEEVPGAVIFNYTDTLYGSSLNFSCLTGSVRSGVSVNGDYTVTCQENRRWGFGNLTCTVGRCTDPGTPGGAVQDVKSYEAGQLLGFRCLRPGYEPVPAAPLLCQQGVNISEWNSTSLPLCTDVTPPKFSNCPNMPFYVDKMEATNFSVPTATDNSGLVKNVTVMPYNFKPGTVVSEDVNVTYTAVDNSGNSATCTISFIIKDRTQPGLICTRDILHITINTTKGVTVDLNDSVSTGATFYPNQFVTLNPSTLDGPRQVKATLQGKWGTSDTCTFLIYTKAEVCFKESLPLVSNAARSCVSVGGNYTCTYNCKSGYVYYDGTTSKQYHCSGANNWSPSASPEDCLMYETPSYKATLEVLYVTGDTLASNCKVGFENMLVTSNTTIANAIDEKCKDLNPGKFAIRSFTSTTLSFKITTIIRGEFIGDGTTDARDTCINIITIILPSVILPVSSVTCSGDPGKATFTVEKIKKSEAGNNCNDNMVLVNNHCVRCPQGRYFSGTACLMCEDGQYQNLTGQATCKSCGGNSVSSVDKTTCNAKCPPGFTSEDGMTNCRPCGKNKYWVNATNCEDCPAGSKTDVMNGVPDIEGCKGSCPPGKYSLTGHEPCQECPLHYYQDGEGQTTCKECGESKRTEGVGHNSSSSCVTIDSLECNSTTLKGCSNGNCHFLNHEAVCICNEGYSGASCETPLDVCQSNPCFNEGTCVPNGDSFNCTCLSNRVCELQKRSGNYVVGDGGYERGNKKSVEACESECLNDEKCRVMYHVNGFCFIVYKDVPPIQYSGEALYYDKVCNHTYRFSGSQCETDLINECKPDTCSAQGMCQDRAEKEPVCLCPIVGEYSQPKCDVVQNLCDPNPCQNGAECKKWGDVRRQCICMPGYTGVNCSVNIKECGLNRDGCLYNGVCEDRVDSYTCNCVSGFDGRHCQVTTDLCSGTSCSNGGCVNNYANATYKCFCDYPYQLGSNGQCKMMDLCNTTNCNNGTCLNGKCNCVDGYEGSICQHSVDDCKTKPCKNGGTCVDGHKDYSCECVSGYTGKDCEENPNDCPGSCNMTYTTNTKDKVDECECICMAGYAGINCTEEINECASYPCKHGATCTDSVNDYHCNCTEGWTGKNCDQQIDYCTTNTNKCQSGKCFNLIDDKYCRCSAGTRGDTCEDIPDVCNVVNPCSTMGLCRNLNGTADCSCQINYSGKSCQLMKDFCTGSTTCLYMGMPGTGGTCTNLESGGYKCQCQTDYSGAMCQTKTTLCSTLNCGSNAQCNDEIGCYCPEGKILTDNKACKLPSNDFDLLFDPQIGDEGAYTTAVLNDPENSDLSFMLWVRFNKDQKDNENTVILKLGKFAEVKNDSITVWNTTNNFVVDLKTFGSPIEMEDGKWRVIVCSWKRNGESLVAVEGVKVFEGMSIPRILPKVFKVEIGKKFGGRISQVKIWANSLTLDDIYKLDENKDYNPPGSTVVHGWYNFKMNKGVVKKSPTQIEKEVCDVPACSAEDKIKPRIKACADDVSKYSADRIFSHTLPKFTDMFEDFNESLSLSSHSTGNTFTWGDYRLLFMASDDNGNTAMCHSKLYVKYNEECPAPRTSSTVKYCSGSSGDICKLECPSNQQLSVPAPKSIPCSELGVYHAVQPKEKIVLPSCGDIMSTTIQIDVSMVYSLQVTCIKTYEGAMETKLMGDFKNKINETWNTLCSSSDCSSVSIKPSCVPSMKQMMVAIQIRSLSNEITRRSDGSEKYTPKEVLRVLIFEGDTFNAKDIVGAKVLNDQVVITDTVSCPIGYMVIGDNCVECSMGTFYNNISQNCEFCPVGTYESSTGSTECTKCDSGKTTLSVGYTSSIYCMGGCPVGKFWNVSECSLCPKHYYQNVTGKDYCSPCPLGKKTSGMGSNSSSQCFNDCPEGTELKPEGKCVKCPRGYYRSFLEDVCMKCPAGNTTERNGSSSKDSCYMTICYNGTYRNKTTNVCEPCPVGEYQPEDLQEECIKCPTNYSTKSAGKINITDCKFYCPKGYEILSAADETCQPCSRGFYKDNSDLFGSCVSCPTGNTTEKMNSISIESCSINECSTGQEINSEGGCSDCEMNKYQPIDMPTSTNKCLSCKDNYGTKQKMSNSSSDCLPMCPGGQFFNQTSMMCEKCPKGSWNNGNFTMKFEGCVACPVKLTTTGPGMTSEDNCTLLDCDPGSYISGTDCLLCDYGFYQPNRHQESCLKCGTNLNTSTEGASKQAECQLYCGAGFEGQDSCTACKEGFFKGGSGTLMCQECTGNLTSNVARTECTELFCDKGFYSNAHQNSCMPCDIGYFKKDRGNALKCTRCPNGFLTPNIASTFLENCTEPFCIPGHYLNSSGVCVQCVIGFYKDLTGNGNCTACPSNLTTPLMGSTELSNCSIVVCDAGEKRISSNNTCMKCPLGYYQPNRGESDCIICGDGQTTEQVGTDTKTGCIPICPAGQEYVSASKTCTECPFGSYKSEIGNKACITCPTGNTTEFTGSISASNCSLPDCMPGTYRSAGGCQNCPVGMYQDQNSQKSCKNCPSDRNTTETTGATSSDFCIKFCSAGQQYDRSNGTCENCPKDFYTNKDVSQYCIKCPLGYITYGEGSDTCVKLSAPDSVTTQAPAGPVEQTLTFNLIYKARVDCTDPNTQNAIKANLLVTIREHLRKLVKRFVKLCSLPEISNCFASIEVKIKNCKKTTSRKRATAEPSTIDVELNIPNLGETVTDNTKNVELQTETVLQEDLDTQKTEYTPTGFTLEESTFVGKSVTCTEGSISTNNNQSCEICPAGTYHDSTSNQCLNCAQNSYQNQTGQRSCKNCPGTIKKYITSTGSKSESDCVSECQTNPNNYCKNGGTCDSNELTIWCICRERFSGPKCEDQAEFASNTPYIIGGAVGGFALLMIIALVVISIVRCLKGSRDSSASKYSQKDELDYNGYNYNVPLQMYDNNSKRGRMPDSYARMNPAFGYDDQYGDTYPRGNYPYREDNSAYRWQEAGGGDYDL